MSASEHVRASIASWRVVGSLAGGTVVSACTLPLAEFFGAMCGSDVKETVLDVVVVMFMVELCLASLLINQSSIYDKANRRKETRTMLPKGLSWYNAILVLGVTLIGLFLFLFRDNVVWFLNETVRLAIYAALFLIKGEAEFMAIDSGDSASIGSGYYPPEANDAWNVIFILAFIACIIIFRKQILSAIKNLFKRIYGFFVKETEQSLAEPEFTDIFEELGSARNKKDVAITYSKLLRKYKNESDGVKKYRLGYQIILKQLKAFNAGIKGADTVFVQHEKGKSLCGADFRLVTECYDRLRYNNAIVTDEELMVLDRLVSGIGKMHKNTT